MLTFEKIRDVERAEKEGKKLQKLPENFLEELKDYLRRKEKTKEKTALDIIELENVKNTIKRLFELRERKLLESALLSVRTGLPPENLTREEEKIFSSVVEDLKRLRTAFFDELSKEPKEREILFRVKKALPSFIGSDLKIYTLKENEIVKLPKELSDLLLKEGVIEEVRE